MLIEPVCFCDMGSGTTHSTKIEDTLTPAKRDHLHLSVRLHGSLSEGLICDRTDEPIRRGLLSDNCLPPRTAPLPPLRLFQFQGDLLALIASFQFPY